MTEEVRKCVDAKTGFFEEYFIVPNSLSDEFKRFVNETKELGESCQSAQEFESRFMSTGLSDCFNSLVSKCQPKPRKMTCDEKKHSKKVAKEILAENRENLVKDALTDIARMTANDIRDEQIAKNRERMIEDGTFADYTITRNRVEGAGRILRFLGGKFKNKNK